MDNTNYETHLICAHEEHIIEDSDEGGGGGEELCDNTVTEE